MSPKKITSVVAALGLASALVIGAGAPAEAAGKYTFIAKSSTGRARIYYYGDGVNGVINRDTPWTKRLGAGGYVYHLSVDTQGSESGTVTCIIKNPRGKVVKKRTATGKYASADCRIARY